MTYLILVLGVLLTRFYPQSASFARNLGFSHWQQAVAASPYGAGRESVQLYLTLAVPVVALVLVLVVLHYMGWRMVAYGVSLVGLLYAFGVNDLKNTIASYLADLNRNDVQAAFHDAASFEAGASEAEDWSQLHQQTLRSISWQYFQCYFPVMFWFAVLGTPGAVLYRLLCDYQQLETGAANLARLQRMKLILEWLPLRIFGLSLAIVGNWRATFKQVVASLASLAAAPPTLVTTYVVAAIHGDQVVETDNPQQEVAELEELPELIDRALISWIALLGVMAVI
ncbi:MAG: regulatory signaling modulator protein AmpE [Porticoccaceae bacterium]|nr:regulatory signaling modulator protein AmpE [Porticoccaceae bacterium]